MVARPRRKRIKIGGEAQREKNLRLLGQNSNSGEGVLKPSKRKKRDRKKEGRTGNRKEGECEQQK